MPANSSRLNVVAREKSAWPCACSVPSSWYRRIGVRPVASPSTVAGRWPSAAAICTASVRASTRSLSKTVIFTAASTVRRNRVAAARFRERQSHGAGGRLHVEEHRAAARRSERQAARQFLLEPRHRAKDAARQHERKVGADDAEPAR